MKRSKIIALFLGLTLSVSAGMLVAPRPAMAIPVFDAANVVQNTISAAQSVIQVGLSQREFLKEFVLDPLAYKLADAARESITKSVVNWVGSGFNGSPAFVTNLEENLLQVGDARAENFLAQLAADNRINSPFKSSILESTRAAYYQNTGTNAFGTAHPYTLNQDCADAEGFLAGRYFDLSCWRAALAPQNNPYGSEILATDALLSQVGDAQETRRQEYQVGSGFLGWRGGSCGSDEGEDVSLSVTDNSLSCPIQTPGSYVIEAAKKAGFSDIDRIVSADEIDEALLGLAGSLLNKIGGDGGLLSAGDSTGGGTRPATDTGGGSAVIESFLSVLDGQISQIGQYQTSLTAIKTAAEGAVQRCGNGNNAGQTFAKNELAKANTALGSSASALSQLQIIRTDVTTSTAVDKTAVVVDANAKYDTLRKSSTFPTPTQIAQAYSDSQDVEDSIVYKLKRMTPGRFGTCSI